MSVTKSEWFARYAQHSSRPVAAVAIEINGETYHLTTDFGRANAFSPYKGQEIVKALNARGCRRPKKRKKFLSASQTLVFMLMLDAALVAAILLSGRTAWPWICLYWILLTLKNLADWVPAREAHKGRIKRLEAQDGKH